MAGRPLGALTIAVFVAILTSRIVPGDARFFVLQVGEAGGWGSSVTCSRLVQLTHVLWGQAQAQPEQENGIETNTYYLVNAAGVGTVRTYSSASLNTFNFGSPFAW